MQHGAIVPSGWNVTPFSIAPQRQDILPPPHCYTVSEYVNTCKVTGQQQRKP